MKHLLSIVCALSLMFFCAEIPAQGVYVTRDKNGTVFSDKPQAGSKELKLPPLTVIPAPPPGEANKAKPPPERPARRDKREPEIIEPYRSLTVIAPADGSRVGGDTSFLELRLAIDPPLRRAEGHAFIVDIDNRPVEPRFTATEFVIPPRFWPDGYLPSNQSSQIDVAVIDSSGQVLILAPSAHFRTLPVIVWPRPYPVRPGYRPPPPPKKPGTPKKPGAPKKPGTPPKKPPPGPR